MKAKIDLEKFICSYVKWSNIQDALRDQGLKCWNGEIVEMTQESEDERIRKEILEFVTIVADSKSNKMEWITWLEKQGEQKPKWTEEDERGSDETIELLEYFINYAPEFRKPAIGRSIAWLKSIKQRLGGEE